jgi:hypothetical protein
LEVENEFERENQNWPRKCAREYRFRPN